MKKNKKEKQHLQAVADLGCLICNGPATIHHCFTYMGGGRDHMKVIPLCWEHHLGHEGIDGKIMAKRVWERKYGSEASLLERVNILLDNQPIYPKNQSPGTE